MESKGNAEEVEAAPVRGNLEAASEELYIHSSFLNTFCSRWKGLEDHLSSIDRSIEERFRELEYGEQGPPGFSLVASSLLSEKEEAAGVEAEVEPRPALKSLCVSMDGKGLLTFIKGNRKDPSDIYKELNAALRAAPDPAALVLDVMDAFYPPKRSRVDTFDGGLHVNRRTCICLLERLHMISPEIKPSVKERAKKLAAEWELLTTDAGQNLEALAFLQLLVSYGISSEFGEDDLVDLLVSIAKKKEAVCICRNLGLHTRMADLIQKLSSKGKQLDAVKFIYASDLVDKFPPVPLLKAYIKECKKITLEMRKSGATKSQNAAFARELDQVKAVIKMVEEYKLESEYPPEILWKRVAHLERQKAEMRHWTGSAATKAPNQQKEASCKRPRISAVTTPTAAASTIDAQLPQLHLPHAQRPYMASTGLHELGGNIPHHDRIAPIHKGFLDLGPPQSQSTAGSLLHSDPRLTSGLYDGSGAYASLGTAGPLIHSDLRLTSGLYDNRAGAYATQSTAGSLLHSDPLVASGLYDNRSGAYAAQSATGNMLLHSDPRVASGLYDRSGTYASYSLSGGLQLQHDPSLYR